MTRCHQSFLALLLAATLPAVAEPVHIEHPLGLVHGYLLIRSQSGAIIGHGESKQFTSGDRVNVHTTFNFRDGSLDDEVAIFTQHGVFALVSDHHIQRGPFFKAPTDVLVEANGNVTVKTRDKNGNEKVETSHMDLPPDLSNGIVASILLNLNPHTAATRVAMVLPSGKGRLAHLVITPDGTQSFAPVAGARGTATLFRICIDLGGVAGVIAPMVGKQPADVILWIVEDESPAFVREVGQLSEGGPIVSIELAGTSFPHAAPTK